MWKLQDSIYTFSQLLLRNNSFKQFLNSQWHSNLDTLEKGQISFVEKKLTVQKDRIKRFMPILDKNGLPELEILFSP